MGVLFDKIRRDLWGNKGRTLQVVLIIAMGAFAIGMIIGTRNLTIAGMEEIWQKSSPAVIDLWTSSGVSDDVLTSLQHIPGVSQVEGYARTPIEWRRSPTDQWSPAPLLARDDYENQKLAKLSLLSGDWPHKKTVAAVQGCDAVFGIQLGQPIYFRLDGDREYVVQVDGFVYDPNIQPPSFGGTAMFYATRDYFEDLTGTRDFNRILAGVSHYDKAQAVAIADQMQAKLEKQNIESGGAAPPNGDRVSDPKKHFFQDTMDGIFFILGILAILALILGLFLVYNTITAIISRQINQVGILKAIGAGTGTVLTLYLINVFIYGFLALVIALPLGAIGARALGTYLLNSFNANGTFTFSLVSPSTVLAQVAIALLSPLLACIIPISTGARVTVREAISTYGLGTRTSLLDRLLARFQLLPQLVSLAISNTFRHKQRAFLTQITLVLSGVVFMVVMSARDSAVYTYRDVIASIFRFNVTFQFKEPARVEHVEAMVSSQAGVKAVEMWEGSDATIRRAGQPESKGDRSALVMGLPVPTTLYGPQMRAGRWLQPGDSHAAVFNQKLAEDTGMHLGDRVTLHHGVQKESDWLIVGLVFDPVLDNAVYVPRDVLLKEMGSVNKANTIWIQTAQDDAASEMAVARGLREYLEQNNQKLYAGSFFGRDTASQIIKSALDQFAIIVTLLATMAVVIGVVGSIALSGVLSLNVLDRRREIGVMRAIGASSGDVAGLFVGAGLILGWLSWLIAVPLSIPAGKFLAQSLGAVMGGEIVYQFTPAGLLYWLAIITVLSAVASWFPARGAARISVREVLAYE
jgi:putative ABC transport system permease protein